jgi:hypothetical protein
MVGHPSITFCGLPGKLANWEVHPIPTPAAKIEKS